MALSQTDILVEVSSWDRQTCQEKLADTLPRIFERLKTSTTKNNSADDKINAIKVLCNNILPCVKVKDLENKLFNKLSCEMKCIFDECLSIIENCLAFNQDCQNRDRKFVTENVNEQLRKIYYILECVERCVMYALHLDDALFIGDIASLPQCVVHLIKGTYKHCKESSEMYKDYNLEEFSEVLSMMFKKSHSIQINFLSLMDKLQLSESMTDNHTKIIDSVCMGLFDICQTVTSLDVKLIVSLWKSISRLLVQYIQFLGEVVDMSAMVVYLCQEVKTGYQYLLQQQLPSLDQQGTIWNQTDEKSFQKSIKILGFEIKILISLCKEYLKFIDERKIDEEIYKLLIFINKHTPQWLSSTIGPEHTDEINRQVVVTCEPFLVIFAERQIFRNCLLGPLKIPDEDSFFQLLMLISVTKSFGKMSNESQDGWMGISNPYTAQHDGILETIFQLTEKCHAELGDSSIMLPGIMCSGFAHKFVSVYEFLATHICGFIGSLLNKYFSILEVSMLKSLFSKNCYVRLLAVDCWCFMDRYGSSNLCSQHLDFFLEVFKKNDNYPVSCESNSIISLMRRLIRFLEPNKLSELIAKNSNPVYLPFWCIFPFDSMQLQSQHIAVINNIIYHCLQHIDDWLQPTNQNVESLISCTVACAVIGNILNYRMSRLISIDQMQIITDKIATVWNILCLNEWDSSLHMDSFIVVLIEILPNIHTYLTNTKLTEIFSLLKELVTTEPSTLLLTGIVKFIEKCSFVTFLPPAVPILIQDILLTIVTNHNCLINHMIMEMITNFAENTKHGEIIPNCLKFDPTLEQKLLNFINKVVVMELNLKDYFRQEAFTLKTANALTWSEEISRDSKMKTIEMELTVAEPCKKRARIDDDTDISSYDSLLKNLESDWSKLEHMSIENQIPVPDWFKASAKVILQKFIKQIG